MPETYENQSQPNASGERTQGGTSVGGAGGTASEDRSFENRPSDTEAAHNPDGAHSVRAPVHGEIGGDMGRDASKGQLQADRQGQGGDAPEGLPPTSTGGLMDHQDPAHADDLQNQVDRRTSGDDLGGQKDDTYEPSMVQSNRMREQGNGVGQKEMDRQRDPSGFNRIDQYGDTSEGQPHVTGEEPREEQG